MDKNAIKKYAVWARRELISRVSQRAALYEITDKGFGDASADSVLGRVMSAEEKRQRQALIAQICEKGYEQVMEEIAYTWFNRFIALRFMEVNGYLPSHVRVFTDDENNFKPQILAEAINMELDGLDMEKVYALKNANDDVALFRYMIIVQCNALSSILPGMFQRISDYTELLFPDNLLREGSVVEQMITMIPEEDWTDQVQIIGWLYQYYNTELKDRVFANLKKNIKITKENIPAATQLFTPDWIVRYMVENSLGRLWIEHLKAIEDTGVLNLSRRDVSLHQEDNTLVVDEIGDFNIKRHWKYYLDEAEQEPDVEAQLAEIRKEYAALTPEEIRVIDPCMGSGHILCVLFDVLVQIYEDYGYTPREAVVKIIENNLWGLDIDQRATQLAYFAVMMKAAQYDRRFLRRREIPQPHVYWPEDYPEGQEFGSLIQVDELERSPDAQTDLYGENSLGRWQFRQALAQKYHVVVTNPPYMGGSGMGNELSKYVKQHFPDSKSDLFACFMERGNAMTAKNGYNCMVTMQSWMFLSSFEKMRKKMLTGMTLSNLMHMDNMVMHIAFGTAVSTFKRTSIRGYKGTYTHVTLKDIIDDETEHPVSFPVPGNRFAQVSADNFEKIPGAPVAYWVSDRFREMFSKENLGRHYDVKAGICTGKNDSFIFFWHEVDFTRSSLYDKSDYLYTPHNKGGEFRKWYGNRECFLKYSLQALKDMAVNAGFRHDGKEYYFRPHIGWSKITSGKSSFRYFEEGFTFDSAGLGLFPLHGEGQKTTLAILNSKIIEEAIALLNPTLNVTPIIVKKLPYVISQDQIDNIVENNIFLSKEDWDSFETSWDFQQHPLVYYRIPEPVWGDVSDEIAFKNCNLSLTFGNWERVCESRFRHLKENEEELNRIFIDIYGLADELTPEVQDKDVTVRRADLGRDIRSLISYAVGCMFGRYSLVIPGLVFAGGQWPPFDKAIGIREKYFPDLEQGICSWMDVYGEFCPDIDGILPITDDEYFEDDITARFVKFIETVYGKATLEENLRFIADALEGKGSSREVIRNYFLNDFYRDHCKIYQKRPIYWLFDSGKKNGFKCLIYMHRYQPDTIARIRTDYVHEQQSRYRTAIADLESRIASAGTGERVKLSKQLGKLQDQAEELRVYEEKIHHLADQMISIDLDDGVKHNYAIFQDVLAKIK